MSNHTQESLDEARLQGVWDRQDRKAIQDHFGDDVELYAAYLDGYDPDGKIVKKVECPNCADQASFAAPGQTVLCKTHDDEKHYREMNEFFDSQLSNLKFSVHMPFCSACGNDEAYYIGYIQGKIVITHYSFCKECRSKLVFKQNAARAAQERIGA